MCTTTFEGSVASEEVKLLAGQVLLTTNSIGYEPRTRAIKKGEDFRAGRWWWENNSGKECGLHK